VNWLNGDFLLASLIWSSIGLGYWIYGKRQQSITPMMGGGLMILVSTFVASILWMSVLCVAVMAIVYWLVKQGY
jgi:UDP-N-acetylmuramyl pentapeptide phosphotransferase/UDP-N-acetylglucosamine-1-phosphate transferase